MPITYKRLITLDEIIPCEKLQEAVWGFNSIDTIPARFMRVLCKHGGFAMGAFDGDKMVGFVFGVPAIHYERPSQHSHMLAVLPEYRGHNIGFTLKKAQRDDGIGRNIDLITWTFDPLQTGNAHLNLNKLGVIACSYEINLYGEKTSSKLHSTLGTDRILAEWWLKSDKVNSIMDDDHVSKRKQPAEGAKINVTEIDKQGLLVPSELNLTHTKDVLLLELPDNIEKMKGVNLQLACRWREHVQKALLHYFSAGYYIDQLQVDKEGQARRTSYVLKHLTKPYKSMVRH